jgi:hypothetical protein
VVVIPRIFAPWPCFAKFLPVTAGAVTFSDGNFGAFERDGEKEEAPRLLCW